MAVISDKTRTKTPRRWWGLALSVLAIVLALFSWFYLWADNEYHARGRYASLASLYLPAFARDNDGVYSEVASSLRNRGLIFGVAVLPVSIVALCIRTRYRFLAAIALAMIILPVLRLFAR